MSGIGSDTVILNRKIGNQEIFLIKEARNLDNLSSDDIVLLVSNTFTLFREQTKHRTKISTLILFYFDGLVFPI